jgi:hypothetical protein
VRNASNNRRSEALERAAVYPLRLARGIAGYKGISTATVRIIGTLDTPVPYSPPLEEFFLPGEAEIERTARLLLRY